MTDSIAAYIDALKGYDPLKDTIITHREIPARAPVTGILDPPLPDAVAALLQKRGIRDLYAHQAEAIRRIRSGEHTVVATPTASGKTMVYNLPVLERYLEDAHSRALYLFPLKALARDQLDTLHAMGRDLGIASPPTAAVYDGDTSSYHRSKIRRDPPSILLTNPEMLHLALLPYHDRWAAFFSNLKTIVVDEVHTCRGVMGSHMAWVFRRLLRICRHYGASPTFVFCSATIANPEALASDLTGLLVTGVDGSGAPAPKKHFLMMDGMEGAARSAIDLLHAALHRKFRTIVYCQSRKMTELIAIWAESRTGAFKGKISAYRAGFLPEERREIEQKMAAGDLLAVISTSALEMGIDIGALDLCILVGYPGTVMATWQRAGRVGRRDREAAIVLIGGEDALDQFMLRNPDTFFTMPPETAVIHPANPVIAGRHLACAAAELPLVPDDPVLDPEAKAVLRSLVEKGQLLETGDGDAVLCGRKYPQRNVSLRGGGERMPILDVERNTAIGEIDRFRAFREAHPGAVYLHHGEHYLIRKLDLDAGVVEAVPGRVHYFTRPRAEKDTEILEVFDTRVVYGTRVHLGRLKVTDRVTGYEKRLVKGQRFLGVTPLDLPPLSFETEGIWLEIPKAVEAAMVERLLHFMGGIHAVEHAAIGILPLVVMCDRNDLGGISIPYHPQVEGPAVFVYDGFPGGIGLCRQAFSKAETVLDRTLGVIESCPCTTGCPACVHSPKCGSGNRPIDKSSAREILQMIFSGTPPEATPPQIVARAKGEAPPDPPDLRYLVLDLETRKSAAEVGGWHRADRMEVSCVVVYDSAIDDFITFLAEDIPELIALLQEADLVVGFNIVRFDYKVLTGYSDFDFQALPTLDLLIRVRDRLGYRLSLDHLGSETLGAEKSADGLKALAWWKEGRLTEIIDYCRQDVALTKDLYLYGRNNGHLLFRNKAGQKVRVPVDFSAQGRKEEADLFGFGV